MNEYNPYNPITLTFLDMSNVFCISIGVVYTVDTFLVQYLLKNVFDILEKANVIWLKKTIFIHL